MRKIPTGNSLDTFIMCCTRILYPARPSSGEIHESITAAAAAGKAGALLLNTQTVLCMLGLSRT